jgi:hypothetical protein
MSDGLVKFKIIESKGFSVHEQPAEKALMAIQDYLQKNGGWFYIDGAVTKIDNVTVETLQNASTVTITNVIVGGHGLPLICCESIIGEQYY